MDNTVGCRARLQLKQVLGTGQFAQVMAASWSQADGHAPVPVAVKRQTVTQAQVIPPFPYSSSVGSLLHMN
jgi:hypothetical protein